MRTRRGGLEAEVVLICTENEARILSHVASFLSGNHWRENYSKDFTEQELNAVFLHVHGVTSSVVKAIDKARDTLTLELRGGQS